MPAFAGRTTVLETLASYGSSCPLPVHKFAWAFGSSHSWLTKVPFWTCQPLRSIPITGTSSLLRADPPLSAASVLSASWVLHLRLFPWHRLTGSQVPCISLDESHAPSTPDTA